MGVLSKRVFGCVLILICFCCALGCKTGGLLEKARDENPTLITAKLRGEKTALLIDLPFKVTGSPKDQSSEIPSDVRDVIFKLQSFKAGNDTIIMNTLCYTFQNGIIEQLSEQDIYSMFSENMEESIQPVKDNSNYSNLKTSSRNNTRIANSPAMIATMTYTYKNKNHLTSKLVYVLYGQELWRVVFDYGQSDKTAEDTVARSIKSIRF